jgi:enoyl-CoA hydratase/carnithine racemase
LALVERSVDSQLGEVVLNRPEKRNALNAAMKVELFEAVADLTAMPEVHCLLIRAAGPDFCAGNDLAEGVAAGTPVERGIVDDWRYLRDVVNAKLISCLAFCGMP